MFFTHWEKISFNIQKEKKECGHTGLVKKDGDDLETLSCMKYCKKLGIWHGKKKL